MPELEVLDVQKEQTAVYLISLSLYIYIYMRTDSVFWFVDNAYLRIL